MTEQNFQVGDKIIRFGRVYVIFKITQEEIDGERQTVIHFKPFYETEATRSLVCSIPVANLDRTNIRLPMSMEKIEELLQVLQHRPPSNHKFNTRLAKEVLKGSDPFQIALLLKQLALVKEDPDINFTFTKRTIFSHGLKRLQEEIALVKGWELTDTKERLKVFLLATV